MVRGEGEGVRGEGGRVCDQVGGVVITLLSGHYPHQKVIRATNLCLVGNFVDNFLTTDTREYITQRLIYTVVIRSSGAIRCNKLTADLVFYVISQEQVETPAQRPVSR